MKNKIAVLLCMGLAFSIYNPLYKIGTTEAELIKLLKAKNFKYEAFYNDFGTKTYVLESYWKGFRPALVLRIARGRISEESYYFGKQQISNMDDKDQEAVSMAMSLEVLTGWKTGTPNFMEDDNGSQIIYNEDTGVGLEIRRNGISSITYLK